MRLQWALLFSAAALGAQAQLVAPDAATTTTALVRRQDTGGEASSEVSEPPAEETSADAGDDNNSSDDGGNNSSPPAEETSSSSSQSEEEQDTTVFRTATVTDDNAETITRRTTVQSTSTFTVVVIQTVFETKTITEKGETATRTIWETSTVVDNDKREFIDLGPRTLPIAVEAYPTEAAVPTVSREDWDQLERANKMMQRDNMLNKRATVTQVTTVTVGDDSQTTVVDTVTQTVVVTRSTARTTTNEVTETEIQDASTTETVTRTLTVTSTAVTTGAQTTTVDEETSSSSGSSDDGGLSTGAKAGIGAGVGVAALLALGALAWFCIRRRRRGPKADPDSLAGASEVPVGGPVGSTPPMSHQSSTHHAAAAGLLAPGGRGAAAKPSPEGYRGTAMGDGRAGYAKPAPYGAAYTQPSSTSPTNRSSTLNSNSPFSPGGQTVSSMGNDSLPSHPGPNDHQAAELGNDNNAAASRWQPSGNAAEMDAAGVGHQSGALPQNVYEMPAQNYR